MIENEIIRVSVLDDDEDFRELLSSLLNKSQGFKCVSTYQNINEALKNIENDLPDILLLDIGIPGKSGIEILKEIKIAFPTIKVMMLTVYSDSEKIFQSLRGGAAGYLLKKSPANKLLEAIREAYNGGAPFSGEVARKVLEYFQTGSDPAVTSVLSDREKEVLEALVDGHSTKAIADKLFVSSHTVRFHLHNIYVKLHVNSRSEAIAKALKSKIV
jgi:DNA-binding NarL/FixJ family response regulator